MYLHYITESINITWKGTRQNMCTLLVWIYVLRK